jgi:LPS export ABC transporter protein LptC
VETDDHFRRFISKIAKSIIGISVLMMLFVACKNDIKKIDELTKLDTLPGEFAEGIIMKVSQKGKMTAYLTAPVMIREEHDSTSYTSFPKGFEMRFYDENEQLKSSIKAKYGKDDQNLDVFEAKDSVIFKSNEKKQYLYTNHLIWNRKEKMIFSYVPFKYIKENSTIYGDTLIADENMEFYTIKKSSADISIERNKL